MQHAAGLRGAFSGGTPQVCAAAVISNWRPAAPTRRMGSQPMGVFAEPPENCGRTSLVQIGLLHADVFPIDIQLLGNQHGQHVAHALAGFRGARHDGDDAVGRNLDEGLWRQIGRRAWSLRWRAVIYKDSKRQAATGKGAQL
jgi:hypothetical protein